MPSKLNPYLRFQSEARQAMDFYKTVFGGNLVVTTFGEAHATQNPSENDKVMHAELTADDGIYFMASDTPEGMGFQPGSNISMSLSGDNEAALRKYFEGLSAGGSIHMPLEKAPWGDTFGMLADKFGIAWMVNIAGPKA